MNAIGLRFDGKVIEELSTKIPSNIFALNELTKNAYDAFSTKIEIFIDTGKSRLVIKDNGQGMSEQDVKKLFHIANSSKKYGSKKTFNDMVRYTQGSKGLGFLSVFKFGNKVSWETYKDGKKIEFSIKKRELVSKTNASTFKVTPEITNSQGCGTIISIDMNDEDLMRLSEYFKDEKYAAKAVNAFYDQSVKIVIDSIHGRSETVPFSEFKKEAEESQFCFVVYSSDDAKINFYRHGKLVDSVDFRISSTNYKISADLMIYHFRQGETKKKSNISKLFYRDADDALSPLLFINDNLFNNYALFDSNVNRAQRSAASMPQMTGYVRVYCAHQDLDFNSDRTNFVENKLTLNISTDLAELNKKIQKIAADIKNDEKESTGEIRTGKAFVDEDKKEEDVDSLVVAKINLKTGISRRYQIPSPQLSLRDFVSSVFDSYGSPVDIENVKFRHERKQSSAIISSVNEECIKEFEIYYEDENTGDVIENLKLEFYAPKATISGASRKDLFTLPSKKSYSVKMAVVSNLMNQVAEIYRNSKGDCYEVIACSLRAILELSVDHLRSEYSIIFTHQKPNDKEYNDSLLWDVVQVVFLIKNNNKLLTELSNSLDVSFMSLKNYLDIEGYKTAVKKGHLGAHKAVALLTPDDIKSLAQRAGHFAVFCDAMLYKVNRKIMNEITIHPLGEK